MNYKWLNKQNNSTCILFFNGWGMDENAIKKIDFKEFDLCMYYNYCDFENIEFVEGYKNIYLIAWSLGVWAADIFISNIEINIKKKIAINGTPKPIDNIMGIPEKIFERTLSTLNPRNKTKFDMRMFGGKSIFDENGVLLSKRSFEDQKNELQKIFELNKLYQTSNNKWDIAYIGKNDMIFPYKNQIEYWKTKSKIVECDKAHFPFVQTSKMSLLVTGQ